MNFEFTIQRCLDNGVERIYETNDKASYVTTLIDLRKYISVYDSAGKRFYGLRYVDDGVVAITGKTIANARGDGYIAAWMYVPSKILFTIPADAIYNALSKITEAMDKYQQTNDTKVFKSVAKEICVSYPEGKTVAVSPSVNIREENARAAARTYKSAEEVKRMFGGTNIVQDAYGRYVGVFFFDKNVVGDGIRRTAMDDLSSETVKEKRLVTFSGFAPEMSVSMAGGKTDVKNEGIIAGKTEKINLRLSRNGFNDIIINNVPVTANNEVKCQDLKLNWEIEITPDRFVVTDAANRQIKGVDVSPHTIGEKDCRNAKMTFRHPDYEDATYTINLVEKPVAHIVMNPKVVNRKYVIEADNAEEEIVISRDERQTSKPVSPIKGYVLTGEGSSKDGYPIERSRPKTWLAVLIGVVIGAIIGAGVAVAFLLPMAQTAKEAI